MSKVVCPLCGSDQIVANRKGFGLGKAVVGGLFTGGIGLLAGFVGSRKIRITCLSCGHAFSPNAPRFIAPIPEVKNKKQDDFYKTDASVILGVLLFVIFAGIIGWIFYTWQAGVIGLGLFLSFIILGDIQKAKKPEIKQENGKHLAMVLTLLVLLPLAIWMMTPY